jgi:hypothetical protein
MVGMTSPGEPGLSKTLISRSAGVQILAVLSHIRDGTDAF